MLFANFSSFSCTNTKNELFQLSFEGYADSLTQMASMFNPKLKNKFDLLIDVSFEIFFNRTQVYTYN